MFAHALYTVDMKMATKYLGSFLKSNSVGRFTSCQAQQRFLHISPSLNTVKAGKIKITTKRNKPVTYEDSFPPRHIAHRKSWNSWNTSTIEGGVRPAETLMDDLFIRKFIEGTFPAYVESKVIIKRQYNMIRIAAILNRKASARKLNFLIGYTEEMLSHWFHCNVKLELQTVDSSKDLIFKYV